MYSNPATAHSDKEGEMAKISRFDEGVLYAAGLLGKYCDHPTEAAWIVGEAGLGDADCGGMDEFDKQNLQVLKGEKGIHLRGL